MKTVLGFSLRINATESLDNVKKQVELALGCTLRKGSYAGVPAYSGEVLGMKIGLGLWRGIGGEHVYQLHGLPDIDYIDDEECDEIQIDAVILDLLNSKKTGSNVWRVPSAEEKLAEGRYDLEDI